MSSVSSETTVDDDMKLWLRIKSMHPYRPRENELNEATTTRATEAVLSWYERLNEFDNFRKSNGHGEYLLILLTYEMIRNNKVILNCWTR